MAKSNLEEDGAGRPLAEPPLPYLHAFCIASWRYARSAPTPTTEEPNSSKVTAEVNRTGRLVTVLKNNKPWVIIQLASTATDDALDVAVDFMDEYADVFSGLAK